MRTQLIKIGQLNYDSHYKIAVKILNDKLIICEVIQN